MIPGLDPLGARESLDALVHGIDADRGLDGIHGVDRDVRAAELQRHHREAEPRGQAVVAVSTVGVQHSEGGLLDAIARDLVAPLRKRAGESVRGHQVGQAHVTRRRLPGGLHQRESEDSPGDTAGARLTIAVATKTVGRRWNVVGRSLRVGEAVQHEHRLGLRLVPYIGCEDEVGLTRTETMDEAGLDPLAPDGELLPKAGPDRELPDVGFARVDRLASRQ